MSVRPGSGSAVGARGRGCSLTASPRRLGRRGVRRGARLVGSVGRTPPPALRRCQGASPGTSRRVLGAGSPRAEPAFPAVGNRNPPRSRLTAAPRAVRAQPVLGERRRCSVSGVVTSPHGSGRGDGRDGAGGRSSRHPRRRVTWRPPLRSGARAEDGSDCAARAGGRAGRVVFPERNHSVHVTPPGALLFNPPSHRKRRSG